METTPALIDDERVRPDGSTSRRLHPSAGLLAEQLAAQIASRVAATSVCPDSPEPLAELDLPFVWVG